MEHHASRKRSSDTIDRSFMSESMPLPLYGAVGSINGSGGAKIPRFQTLQDATGSSESDSGSAVLTPSSAAVPARSAHAWPMAPATAPSTVVAGASDAANQPDDKVLRRRLQYKMHQRRHRAKQKAKIESLEHEVHGLLSDVASLEATAKRLQTRNVFATRGSPSGQPVRVVLEFFRVYEHGWSPQRWREQEQFLQSVTTSGVEGPDYVGIDTIKNQWRLYGHYFVTTQLVVHNFDVARVDDLTIVVVDVTLVIRPRRSGVTTLCPSLTGHEALIQDVIGNSIEANGTYRFVFDNDGRVNWLGADMDFVAALQRTLGSLSKAALAMHNAHMSFSTGQIRCDPSGSSGSNSLYHDDDGQAQSQRHHVDYLLS